MPPSFTAVFLVGAAMALFLVLYLLDFSHWKGNCGTALRRLGSAAVLLLIAAGGMLSIDDFPILPLAIALLLLPFAALFLRTTLYRSNDSSDVRPPVASAARPARTARAAHGAHAARTSLTCVPRA